jgi:hypothetical protein
VTCIAGRERRFRKQRSSARQNASPTSIVQCHGARTRRGPRGGGRLRVLSTVAFAPPSIVCSTGVPGRRRPLAHISLSARDRRWREIPVASVKPRLVDRRRHLAGRYSPRAMPHRGDAMRTLRRDMGHKPRRSRVAEANHRERCDVLRGRKPHR